MSKSTIRRLGITLSVLALTLFLWGCGQTAPTAVEVDQGLEMSDTADSPTGDQGDGVDDGWW